MADTLTTSQRSALMSRVRGMDTTPELILRSAIHRAGFRYGLHRKDLPGRPDLVFASRRKVIFVHGCFWHGHEGCNQGRIPQSNRKYWRQKLATNRERDSRTIKALRELGWQPHVVWGCELRTFERRLHTISATIQFLNSENDAS
jgi:DNA mismatch endonuclease, patch repair protein